VLVQVSPTKPVILQLHEQEGEVVPAATPPFKQSMVPAMPLPPITHAEAVSHVTPSKPVFVQLHEHEGDAPIATPPFKQLTVPVMLAAPTTHADAVSHVTPSKPVFVQLQAQFSKAPEPDTVPPLAHNSPSALVVQGGRQSYEYRSPSTVPAVKRTDPRTASSPPAEFV